MLRDSGTSQNEQRPHCGGSMRALLILITRAGMSRKNFGSQELRIADGGFGATLALFKPTRKLKNRNE
jgi:hypothetical protein